MADGIMKRHPEDVLIYILCKFRVKSLLRFKGVSRTWYSLVQSSTFINLHLNRTTTTRDEFIIFSRSVRKEPNGFRNVLSILSSDNDDDLNPVFPDLDPPYLTFTEYYVYNKLVGPCNGLIALTDFEVIVLFNPATRNYMLLPPSPACPKGFRRNFRGGVGFGFDSIRNDYKFVRISELCMDSDWIPVEEQKVEVYDLSIDSWRELDHVDRQLPTVHWLPHFEIFHMGSFHWYADTDTDTMVILCFDMSTEIFRNVMMPDSCNGYDGKCYSLKILNRSLTLICYPDPFSDSDPTQDSMVIWIMMEYGAYESWTKEYTIRPLPIEYPLTILRDHLFFLESKSGHLVCYNLTTDEVKEFNLHGYPESLRVMVYKESLTSIPKRVQ
uniref:S7-locus linked F-box protein 1 n=1 Tax=Petunia hybrida TaxID=4102 RepID=A0A140JNI9_PETHY|nr:S7-locus linked F-box protein 1 [Petunia x hybrida]